MTRDELLERVRGALEAQKVAQAGSVAVLMGWNEISVHEAGRSTAGSPLVDLELFEAMAELSSRAKLTREMGDTVIEGSILVARFVGADFDRMKVALKLGTDRARSDCACPGCEEARAAVTKAVEASMARAKAGAP